MRLPRRTFASLTAHRNNRAIQFADEKGSGTVMSAGIIMGVLVILGIIVAVMNGILLHSHLQNVANTVVLAGGDTVLIGGDGCKLAQTVARANDATVDNCEVLYDTDTASKVYTQNSPSNDGTQNVPNIRITVKLHSDANWLISAESRAKTSELECYE